MKRLTKSGASFCTNSGEHDILVELDKDNYEEAIYDLDRVAKMLNRLAELEDKLESGKLLELPCGIGDTAYWNNGICITPYRADGFADYNDDMGLRLIMGDMQPSLLLLGKDLFFDKGEAESSLAAEKQRKD